MEGGEARSVLGTELGNALQAPSPFEFELVAGMTRRDIVNPPEEWRNYLPPGQLERLCPSR